MIKESIGQVYKVHSNSYFVKLENEIVKCGARGVLKIKSDGISVGDYIIFKNNTIERVLERKNKFIRPNVSNIDLIVAVFSPEPKPDFYLLDKLLINATKENVELIIVINKTDLDSKLINKIQYEYGFLGIKVISVCAKTGDGIDDLKSILEGKLSVLAGQSAAGKTSIINKMFGLSLTVGDLSEKVVRGKHTTTRSEVFEFGNIKIIDSPGFAAIDADVDVKELPDCYIEYSNLKSQCKFRDCAHIKETECKVREMVEKGLLSKERYLRYLEIYDELSKRRIIYEKN